MSKGPGGESQGPIERPPRHQPYYRIVVNDETCFAIWPAGVAMPPGWVVTGFTGSALACLRQVAELWRNRDHELDSDAPDAADNAQPPAGPEADSG